MAVFYDKSAFIMQKQTIKRLFCKLCDKFCQVRSKTTDRRIRMRPRLVRKGRERPLLANPTERKGFALRRNLPSIRLRDTAS